MPDKIAILGGTFDPIHLAHLRTALEAVVELDLPCVHLMPLAAPPHHKSVQASLEHRLAMCRLAVAGHERFKISDLEARLGGVSRTIKTLEHLRELHPDSELYFLVGSDAFYQVHQWHQARRLFDLAHFVVLGRPGTPKRDLLAYLKAEVDPEFTACLDGWYRAPGAHGVYRVSTTLLSISSTRIKKRVAAGIPISFLVPPAVEEYIKLNNLYRSFVRG